MKLLCLLLAVYVILLSAKPCCADNDCQAKFAAKKELSGKMPTKECPGGCSPFFTCGSCVGFILSKPFTITLPLIPEDQIAYYTAYQQAYIEKIALSIWLPPKIS